MNGSAIWDVSDHSALSPAHRATVIDLADEALAADEVAALSEATVLALDQPDDLGEPLQGGTHTHGRHLLAWDGPDLVGYASMTPSSATAPASAELVVAPRARRRGVGTALLRALWERDPAVRVWAHGDLPAAASLARHHRLSVVRELWQLTATLDPAPHLHTDLPDGFRVRPFEAADAQAWLTVNGRAFADHPEQGRLGPSELATLLGQPWFDAEGFLLVIDHNPQPTAASAGLALPAGNPRLAAFHWTKVLDGVGEVYVLGIDPDYQGRGLAEPLTAVGLEHLRSAGVSQVRLYVEATNSAAVRIYRRLGFARSSVDVMYARPVG